MKKSRWADWFLTAGFLGFLALALAVTLIRPKSGWSYYENRNLAHPAELSVETLLDGTFPASVEPVLQDHAAGRNTLMKLSVWVDLHLFHRPVVNQVVPADGMLLGWNPYETPDPAGITAQAEHMAEELARLAKEHSVDELVMGFPRNMDGTEGPRAELYRAFAARLEEVCGLKPVLWDERRTTIDAHNILFNSGKNAKQRKKVVDAVAASLILEGYLTFKKSH